MGVSTQQMDSIGKEQKGLLQLQISIFFEFLVGASLLWLAAITTTTTTATSVVRPSLLIVIVRSLIIVVEWALIISLIRLLGQFYQILNLVLQIHNLLVLAFICITCRKKSKISIKESVIYLFNALPADS